MSIADKLGKQKTVTEGLQAYDLFTDRIELIRLFLSYLNDDPKPEKILFLHGIGGIGKSLLLRVLRDRYCKRFESENWTWVKQRPVEEFENHADSNEGIVNIPSALLDFRMQPRGEDRPQECFSALLMLRRQLGLKGIRFPVFDFACVWYLHRTGLLTEERLRNLFPPEEMDFLSELSQVILESKYVVFANVLAKLFGKHFKEGSTLYLQKRNLEPEIINRIQRMDPDSDLMDYLPELFAGDLAAASGTLQTDRLVLFFDTHEAFWGEDRDSTDDIFFQKDEWFRNLLFYLPLEGKVVAVVAGRDLPRWSSAKRFPIQDQFIDIQTLEGLQEKDAVVFLTSAGIDNDEMCAALINYTKYKGAMVHPLFLGLCVDVIKAAQKMEITLLPSEFSALEEFRLVRVDILNRLFRYVHSNIKNAILALSACRSFDFELYVHLGVKLHFQTSQADFENLTRFSFVWRSGSEIAIRFRIHELIQRTVQELHNDSVFNAHKVLEEYFSDASLEGNGLAVVESIWHAIHLDPVGALPRWGNTFGVFFGAGRLDICKALVEIRSELKSGGHPDESLILNCEAKLFMALGRYEEARAVAEKALRLFEPRGESTALAESGYFYKQADSFDVLGQVEKKLGLNDMARRHFVDATAACDQGVARDPQEWRLLVAKASALIGLADLERYSSDYTTSQRHLEEAVAAANAIPKGERPSMYGFSRVGYSLVNLGELHADSGRFEDAIRCYEQAIDACQEGLSMESPSIDVFLVMCWAFWGKGEILQKQGSFPEALDLFQKALKWNDESISISRGDKRPVKERVGVLLSIAETLLAQNLFREAADCAQEAVSIASHMISVLPDSPDGFVQRGNSMTALGNIELSDSQLDRSAEYFEKAALDYGIALERSIEKEMPRQKKAYALSMHGIVNVRLGNLEKAVSSYSEAKKEYGELNQTSNPYSDYLLGEADTSDCLGRCFLQLERRSEAALNLKHAINRYSRFLAINPTDQAITDTRGRARTLLKKIESGKILPE